MLFTDYASRAVVVTRFSGCNPTHGSGYGRAAHLIDMMERDGLVGPADGSKPREILKAPDYYKEVDTALR